MRSSRSIDTVNKIQYKQLISSLNRLIIKKSKKIFILKKRSCCLNFQFASSTEIYQSANKIRQKDYSLNQTDIGRKEHKANNIILIMKYPIVKRNTNVRQQISQIFTMSNV